MQLQIRRFEFNTSKKVWDLLSRHSWIFKAKNEIPGKRPLRKLLMQRHKHCYNYLQVPPRSIQNIFKGKSLQKRTRKTLKRISQLILFLLTYLLASTLNNLLPTRVRLVKRTKTIKEIFWHYGRWKQSYSYDSPIIGTNSNVIKKERKDIFHIKYFKCKKKGITSTNVLKPQRRCQKTSLNLGNLYASNNN